MKPEGRVLATLEEDGRRRWLRPKPSAGVWWKRRLIVAWALIAVYAVIPWVSVAGMPMILLDLVERKFVFFGAVFRPTETLLFGVLFLSVFVAVFLLTAIFGRVWCGWACPQTVYMEFVYRPIERLFLGRAYANRRARVAGWRMAGMYVAFFVVSAHLANTLLAWFVGADRLTSWIFTTTPAAHPVAFSVFAGVTLLVMFDFVYFREQLCSLVCPYGRLQSALIDRDSLIVGYDPARGEPRGKMKDRGCGGGSGCDGKGGCGSGGDACNGDDHRHARAEATVKHGDCIDCMMCVTTCPAGIDIRDGVQLECIQCTQCIDACDAVMTMIDKPKGLIRYSSQRALDGAPREGIRARLVVYPTMLAGLIVASAYMIATRQTAAVSILRTQGNPYIVKGAQTDAALVESIVRMRIDNRTRGPLSYTVVGGEGVELIRLERVEVAGDSSREIDVVVRSAPSMFVLGRREIMLQVNEDGSRDGAFRGAVEAVVLGPLIIAPLPNGGSR